MSEEINEEIKIGKVKTHTNIAVKIGTKEKIEEYRRYERETYDEILGRWYETAQSRKGKSKKGEDTV